MSNDPRIILASNLWATRFEVSIEPRRLDRPTRSFRALADAQAHAEALHQAHGWPVEDRHQWRIEARR